MSADITTESPRTQKLGRHDVNMLKGTLVGQGCREYFPIFVDGGLKSVQDILDFRDGFEADTASDSKYAELIAHLTPDGGEVPIAGASAGARVREMRRVMRLLRDRATHVRNQRLEYSMGLYALGSDNDSDGAPNKKKHKSDKKKKKSPDTSSDSDSDSDDERRRRKRSKEQEQRRQEERDTRKMHDLLETLPCGGMAPERTPNSAGRRAVTEALEGSKPGLPDLASTDWGYSDFSLPSSNDRATSHARAACVLDTIELGAAVNLAKRAYKHISQRQCDKLEGVGDAKGEAVLATGIQPARLRTWYTMYTRAADEANLSRDEAWAFFGKTYSAVSVSMRREGTAPTHAIDGIIADRGLFTPTRTAYGGDGNTRGPPGSGDSGGAGSGGTKNIPCKDFANGRCQYGARCRFSHAGEEGKNGERRSEKSPSRDRSKGRDNDGRTPSAGRTPGPKAGKGKSKAVQWEK